MEAQKSDIQSDAKSFTVKHSFALFIAGTILISSFMVFISMAMYNSSGAAQLDLSRPGYVSVRSQAAGGEDDFKTYSSFGTLDEQAIEEFKSLFDKQASKIKTVDAFGGSPSPLSPESLGIDEDTVSTSP